MHRARSRARPAGGSPAPTRHRDRRAHAVPLPRLDARLPWRVRMRAADPVHNVELRLNHHGQESVVFAFPYRADIVDAVRSIPGRRFAWEAKEWWAPRADATAAYLKGVLEKHESLSVSPEVEAWLAPAGGGRVGGGGRRAGRWSAGRVHGEGPFALDKISGELPEPLAALAVDGNGRD